MPELIASLRRAEGGFRRALPLVTVAFVALASIAGLVLGYGFITTSDRFAVRSFDVRGNRVLSGDQVAALLGVAPGDNIFGVKVDDLGRRLERNPWIASARVLRSLPDALVVTIEERVPAALVELGGLYLADERGRIFKRAAIERGEGADLPVVTGLRRDEYIHQPEPAQAAIRDALAALALYRSRDGRPAVGEVHIDARQGTSLLTHDGAVVVRLGRGDETTLRARLHAFDLVWNSLTPSERERARAIYADDGSQSDRVTVAFGDRIDG